MSQSNPLFIIIDGNAILHRAWHAIPPLSTKTGLVVTGVYGFTMLLLRVLKDLAPSHIAVTFDLPGETFRHEAYEEYKAQRDKKPDELYAQIPLIRRVLEAMKIPVYTSEGFEADDVLGSFASWVCKEDPKAQVMIVTGDLDTLQLVNDRVSVFTLRKGMSDTVTYTPAMVRERYQLDPSQMVDYKAFRGDPSDNIPGVKGIGEKTAIQLLTDFGTLEAVYEAARGEDSRISKGVREKLLASEKEAMLAKKLSKIICDLKNVKPAFSVDAMKVGAVYRDMVAPIFEEFQFTRLIQQVPERVSQGAMDFAASPARVVAEENVDVKMCENADEAQVAIERIAKSGKRFAWKTLCADSPVSPEIQYVMVTDGKSTVVVPGALVDECGDAFRALFASSAEKVCHDVKQECQALAKYGLSVVPGAVKKVFDLMLASYLLYSSDRKHEFNSIMALQASSVAPEKPTADEYRDWVVSVMPRLCEVADDFAKEMKEKDLQKIFDEIDSPLAYVLARMEMWGVTIDEKHFASYEKELEKDISSLTAEIYRMAGREFNINSPLQMKEVLFDELGISAEGMKKTSKSKTVSTAASELEKLKDAHPIIAAILSYREVAKIKSTYVDSIPLLVSPVDGRVHGRFNQTVAATGRLASADPNLQNIPTTGTEYGKKLRQGFVAEKGYVFVAADYSQFELRVIAHIAREKSMIEAFKSGEDIHQRTAVMMFGEDRAKEMRRVAKAINFGILYGMGPKKLSESAGISFSEAQMYIEQYFAMHPGISEYLVQTKEMMKNAGYVETLYGRKRYFPHFSLLGFREKAEAERQAINMPVQGSQADILRAVMVKLHEVLCEKYADGSVRMLMQVHDELIFEVRNDLVDEVVKNFIPIMENTVKLDVPIVVNVKKAERWGDME